MYCGAGPTPRLGRAGAGVVLPPALQAAAQETLAAVGSAAAAPASPAAPRGMDACWARASDLLTSGDAAEAAQAQLWLLQLLMAAAERQQQLVPGTHINSTLTIKCMNVVSFLSCILPTPHSTSVPSLSADSGLKGRRDQFCLLRQQQLLVLASSRIVVHVFAPSSAGGLASAVLPGRSLGSVAVRPVLELRAQ